MDPDHPLRCGTEPGHQLLIEQHVIRIKGRFICKLKGAGAAKPLAEPRTTLRGFGNASVNPSRLMFSGEMLRMLLHTA